MGEKQKRKGSHVTISSARHIIMIRSVVLWTKAKIDITNKEGELKLSVSACLLGSLRCNKLHEHQAFSQFVSNLLANLLK